MFAKPPAPGRVKTRLAATIGEAAAVALAQAMLCDVWETVMSVAAAEPVLATTDLGPFPELLVGATTWLQGDGDLGARLERIAQRAIAKSGRVILLGADSPELKPPHLEAAISLLSEHDAVIGPSFDGGYYLLGLARCPNGLLDDLPWSTPGTCAKTEARLQTYGFSIAKLPALGDIDVHADLLACSAPGPHTKRWMQRWLA